MGAEARRNNRRVSETGWGIGFRRLARYLAPPTERTVPVSQLAAAALLLGATSFGGGVAMIAHARRLFVAEKGWLSDEEFLDGVSLAQSLPGANAANAVSYVGWRVAGAGGAAVALACFLLPSAIAMVALALAYDHIRGVAFVENLLRGFTAAIVGLVAAITARLGQAAVRRQWHLELGVAAAFVLVFTKFTVAEVVLAAGLVGIFVLSAQDLQQRQSPRRERADEAQAEKVARQTARIVLSTPQDEAAGYEVESSLEESTHKKPRGGGGTLISFLPAIPIVAAFVVAFQVFVVFLRVGAVTFGGGYVMVPQIQEDVVNVRHWLTEKEFADAMAFGQLTPGPTLITATWIGFRAAGFSGALAATVGVFLPSFLMTIFAGASLARFRTNRQVQAFLAGVAPAVVGMLAAAAVSLARGGVTSPLGWGTATLAFLLALRARLNPVLIVLGCGLLQMAVAHFVA